MCMCLPRQEEGVRSLELVLHVCKPSHMGARNPTLVLCKNSILFYLLSRVSNPSTLPRCVTQVFIFFDFSVISCFLECSFMIFKIPCISYKVSRLCLLHCLFPSPVFPGLSSLPHFVPSPHVELPAFHYDSNVSLTTSSYALPPLVPGYLLNINYNYIPN